MNTPPHNPRRPLVPPQRPNPRRVRPRLQPRAQELQQRLNNNFERADIERQINELDNEQPVTYDNYSATLDSVRDIREQITPNNTPDDTYMDTLAHIYDQARRKGNVADRYAETHLRSINIPEVLTDIILTRTRNPDYNASQDNLRRGLLAHQPRLDQERLDRQIEAERNQSSSSTQGSGKMTIKSIKAELKRLKIKGITGKTKAQLMAMLPKEGAGLCSSKEDFARKADLYREKEARIRKMRPKEEGNLKRLRAKHEKDYHDENRILRLPAVEYDRQVTFPIKLDKEKNDRERKQKRLDKFEAKKEALNSNKVALDIKALNNSVNEKEGSGKGGMRRIINAVSNRRRERQERQENERRQIEEEREIERVRRGQEQEIERVQNEIHERFNNELFGLNAAYGRIFGVDRNENNFGRGSTTERNDFVRRMYAARDDFGILSTEDRRRLNRLISNYEYYKDKHDEGYQLAEVKEAAAAAAAEQGRINRADKYPIDSECGVCYDPLSDTTNGEPVSACPSGHIYHRNCLRNQTNCPECRAPFNQGYPKAVRREGNNLIGTGKMTIKKIKAELKRLKIKGITGKTRGQLMAMLPKEGAGACSSKESNHCKDDYWRGDLKEYLKWADELLLTGTHAQWNERLSIKRDITKLVGNVINAGKYSAEKLDEDIQKIGDKINGLHWKHPLLMRWWIKEIVDISRTIMYAETRNTMRYYLPPREEKHTTIGEDPSKLIDGYMDVEKSSEKKQDQSGAGNKSSGFIRAIMARNDDPENAKMNQSKFRNLDKQGMRVDKMSKATHDVIKTKVKDKKHKEYLLENAIQHQPLSEELEEKKQYMSKPRKKGRKPTLVTHKNYVGTYDMVKSNDIRITPENAKEHIGNNVTYKTKDGYAKGKIVSASNKAINVEINGKVKNIEIVKRKVMSEPQVKSNNDDILTQLEKIVSEGNEASKEGKLYKSRDNWKGKAGYIKKIDALWNKYDGGVDRFYAITLNFGWKPKNQQNESSHASKMYERHGIQID